MLEKFCFDELCTIIAVTRYCVISWFVTVNTVTYDAAAAAAADDDDDDDDDELFCGMVDQQKAISLISSRDHCQRSSPSRISDTPRAGFEPAQNLTSGLVEWSCAVKMSITPR